MPKRKGSNVEREIRNKFYSKGILSFRVAGSGSTRKVPALDLIIVHNRKAIGLEVKYMKKTEKLYLRPEQFKELEEISKHIPVYLAVKIPNKGIFFLEFEKYKKGISQEEIIRKGVPFNAFLEKIKSRRLSSQNN